MNRSLANIIVSLLLLFPVLTGCKKNEGGCVYQPTFTAAPQSEVDYLQDFLITNNIPATQHSSGAFYIINSTGNGNNPNVCSIIRVSYEGRLLDGTVFDSNLSTAGVTFTLGELIKGWQMLLPLVKPGGILEIYVPPTLGYGSTPVRNQNGNIIIPANSYLHFYIKLLDVQ